MMTSAVCTPSWVVVMNETSLTEVPRLPATSGFRTDRQAGPSAGRSSIEVLGPAGRRRHAQAPFPPDPRTTTEDRPLGAVGAPGPGPRDVVLFLLAVIQLPPAGKPGGRGCPQPTGAGRAFRSARGSGQCPSWTGTAAAAGAGRRAA